MFIAARRNERFLRHRDGLDVFLKDGPLDTNPLATCLNVEAIGSGQFHLSTPVTCGQLRHRRGGWRLRLAYVPPGAVTLSVQTVFRGRETRARVRRIQPARGR